MAINDKFTSYWVRSRDITYADNGTTVGAIYVPSHTFVSKVIAHVETAFSATGTVDCGDGTDPDGWIDTLQMSAAAVGIKLGTGGDSAYWTAQGKGYTSADTIDVYVADGTSGSLFIMAELVPFYDIA
jgi:hypothetical protein